MNKIFQTINDLYNKFLPIAEKSGVELNLDYSDPATVDIDVETDDPELKAQLESELKNAITRANSGSVKLKIANGKVTISDTGTTLSRPLCEALSHGRVSVKSRVGFGTNVDISLTKAEKPAETTTKQLEKTTSAPSPAKIAAKTNKASKTTKKH